MPRSLMNATLRVGGMAVPVKLHTATTDGGIHFREVHLKDGAKIEHRRFCTKEDKEVPYEEVVKGHEIAEGEYAVLTKEELAAATPGGDKSITVEEFVPGADIDQLLYDRAYRLGVGDDGAAGYRLLHDALAKTKKVGIAFFVFHDRERLAAVVPQDGVLVLQTLRAADELVPLDELRPDFGDARAPTAKERKMAGQLVETLHEPFVPDDYADEHRKLVLKLIEAKAGGEEIDVSAPDEPEVSDDLAAALQASLDERAHSGRRRRATAKSSSGAKKKPRRAASSSTSKKKGG